MIQSLNHFSTERPSWTRPTSPSRAAQSKLLPMARPFVHAIRADNLVVRGSATAAFVPCFPYGCFRSKRLVSFLDFSKPFKVPTCCCRHSIPQCWKATYVAAGIADCSCCRQSHLQLTSQRFFEQLQLYYDTSPLVAHIYYLPTLQTIDQTRWTVALVSCHEESGKRPPCNRIWGFRIFWSFSGST